jgi:hypothetical protein
MDEVYIVTVFDAGEGDTSVWGVFSNLRAAQDYEKHLNSNSPDLQVAVSSHEVSDSYEDD